MYTFMLMLVHNLCYYLFAKKIHQLTMSLTYILFILKQKIVSLQNVLKNINSQDYLVELCICCFLFLFFS